MQNCYYFKQLISNYLDGEINYNDKDFFEKHLEECPQCSQLFNSIKSTKKQLQNIPVPELSPEFHTNLRNKILQIRENQSQPSGFFDFFNKIPALSYGFAAALVILITAFSIHQYQNMAPASSTTTPKIVKDKLNQKQMDSPQQQFVTQEGLPYHQDSIGNGHSDSVDQDRLENLKKKITPVKGQ
ncbi:MAG TPA: anti-sigma factor [bacterium]|nr:anti-sigma factor [bacterium]